MCRDPGLRRYCPTCDAWYGVGAGLPPHDCDAPVLAWDVPHDYGAGPGRAVGREVAGGRRPEPPMRMRASTRPQDWTAAQALLIFNRVDVEQAHGAHVVEQAIRERQWLRGRVR